MCGGELQKQGRPLFFLHPADIGRAPPERKYLMDLTHHIAVLYVELFIGEAQSLKEKRMVLRRLKDRVRLKFNVSIAEIEGMDKWQRSTLAFGMVGKDKKHIDQSLSHLLSFLGKFHSFEILDHQIEFL